MIQPPKEIQIIGTELAIRWRDDREDYIPVERLRAASPSAENVGERDILGQIHGGTAQTEFPGVEVRNWRQVGNYALQFTFSDGHQTGIYSFRFLQQLSDALDGKSSPQE